MCRRLARLKAFPHVAQLCGFSAVCVDMCRDSSLPFLNVLPHVAQINGFPVWTFKCVCSFDTAVLCTENLSHVLHLKVFLPMSVLPVRLCPCLTKPETGFLFSCELLQSSCRSLFDTSEPIIYFIMSSGHFLPAADRKEINLKWTNLVGLYLTAKWKTTKHVIV